MRFPLSLLPSKWPKQKLYDYSYDLAAPMFLNIALLPFVFVNPVRHWLGERSFLCFVFVQ